jgi:hypothetical protein
MDLGVFFLSFFLIPLSLFQVGSVYTLVLV